MNNLDILEKLNTVLVRRKSSDAGQSYVASLYQKGEDEILRKIDEEAREVGVAGCGDNQRHLIHEVADLWFHCMVLLAYKNVHVGEVLAELDNRFGVSGHQEKRQRKNTDK